MHNNSAVIVAFLEQDHLGVGYIASVLLQNNIDIRIVDFRIPRSRILSQILDRNPAVVGFSVIFQYHIQDFQSLVAYLRRHGVSCHLTTGGHYPSLRFAELLDFVPELDSVVLFEGEYTFLELVQTVGAKNDWKHIKGIAYRDKQGAAANPLRPLEPDLDTFPPPVRQPLKEYALGKKYATILASRGCYHNCSFCSIRQFYSNPGGPLKRIRRPEMVVREMELLHQQLGCSVFMFQDDDFPLAGAKAKDWARTFCQLLTETGMGNRVMWKINCRPDEVDAVLFQRMRDAGLFLVYLGIEDGTECGLRLMNKRMDVETTVRAVDTLKRLRIRYDFGFMLFHPETTFETLVQNLDFLERICGDGSSPITFCKMLPYAETTVERQLKEQGRLKGALGREDYDFIDPALCRYYSFVADCFGEWMGEHDGLLNAARWTKYSMAVYQKYAPITTTSEDMEHSLSERVAQSNMFFLHAMRSLTSEFTGQGHTQDRWTNCGKIRSDIAARHLEFKERLTRIADRVRRAGATNAADVYVGSADA